MAVLCEAISVVVRADRLLETFEDFDAFKDIVPNETLAADDEVVRVGFMDPDDAKHFVNALEERGLVYQDNGKARDLVVIDQISGLLFPCDWVEFGRIPMKGHEVGAARLVDSTLNQLIMPEGWKLEGSLTQTYTVVPRKRRAFSKLKFSRTENGVNVYVDERTGKELFLGRTTKRDE